MNKPSRDTVGSFFTTNGQDIWQHIFYCEHPTATLVNLQTQERRGGAVGSPILSEFKLLDIKEDE